VVSGDFKVNSAFKMSGTTYLMIHQHIPGKQFLVTSLSVSKL